MNIMNFSNFNHELDNITDNDFANITSKVNFSLSLFGLFGNIICFAVFIQRKMRMIKFNLYLLVLSIFEISFCFILLINYLFQLFNKDNLLMHQLNKLTTISFDYFVHNLDSTSHIITLILSINCLYAIKNPLKIKEFFTNLHPKFVTVVSVLSIFLLRIPIAVLCNHEENEILTNSCNFVSPIIFNILPIISVLIVNSILIKEIVLNPDSLVDHFMSHRLSTVETSVHYKNSLVEVSITKLNPNKIYKNKMSRYISIIIISLWSVVTTITYFIFNIYCLILNNQIFKDPRIEIDIYVYEKIKTVIRIQSLASILFNSNHCISVVFYLLFYSMFRDSIFSFFKKIFKIKKTHVYD